VLCAELEPDHRPRGISVVAPGIGQARDEQQAVPVLVVLAVADGGLLIIGAVVGDEDQQSRGVLRHDQLHRAARQPGPAVRDRIGDQLRRQQDGRIGPRVIGADGARDEPSRLADLLRTPEHGRPAEDE
jgi:hypothetical protein